MEIYLYKPHKLVSVPLWDNGVNLESEIIELMRNDLGIVSDFGMALSDECSSFLPPCEVQRSSG